MPSSPLNVEAFEAENVHGYLHKASGGVGDGMVLTHGAGGGNLRDAASDQDFRSLSKQWCDRVALQSSFPATETHRTTEAFGCGRGSRRPRVPAVAALRKLVGGRMTLSGVSYGGRQASILAANEPDLVDALMLFSYPLHPPGKPTGAADKPLFRASHTVAFRPGIQGPVRIDSKRWRTPCARFPLRTPWLSSKKPGTT